MVLVPPPELIFPVQSHQYNPADSPGARKTPHPHPSAISLPSPSWSAVCVCVEGKVFR